MRKSILTLLASTTIILTATAQEPTNPIDSIARRVESLEKRSNVWDKINQHLDISGFVQAAYNWDDRGTSTFNLRRARLSLSGNIFKDERGAKADYRLQAEFASSPKIVDLWVRYQPFNALGVQLGQFKMPLMLELTEYSQPKLGLIDFSLAVQRLQRMGSNDITAISSIGRDMGVQLYGGFIKRDGYSIINYNLAVVNGGGINTKDNNSSKDLIGRIVVKPIAGLSLAGFYMRGEGNFSSSSVLGSLGEVANPKFVSMHRYGGGVVYQDSLIFVRAEYIKGQTGQLDSDGAYAAAGYTFNKKFSMAMRWDYFDEDLSTKAKEYNYTIGANYTPWKNLLLQLNYTYKQYENMEIGGSNAINFMVTTLF